jgi:hypothetical protein
MIALPLDPGRVHFGSAADVRNALCCSARLAFGAPFLFGEPWSNG